MDDILQKTIDSVQRSEAAFRKFISANDAGKTGGHQSGYYIGKSFLTHVFEQEVYKGEDYTLLTTIRWQDDFETESRFKYYGSKNECHLTRFGIGFPFLTKENMGDLLVLCKKSKTYYEAFILQSDENIDDFFAELNISPTQTNGIIPKQYEQGSEEKLLDCFITYLNSLKQDFPSTIELAKNARNCYNNAFSITENAIQTNPDNNLIEWITAEYQLFKNIENDRYLKRIQTPFKTVEELVITANTILNRRKSRAGKSLEHHLNEIFKTSNLQFETQSITEDNKRPDFLFPGIEAYTSLNFDNHKLITLASKTTCKDRWRQILNEADKVKVKHLFTLQQSISENQLSEMYKYNVCLVVPKPYIKRYPENFRNKILSLNNFIDHVKSTQN